MDRHLAGVGLLYDRNRLGNWSVLRSLDSISTPAAVIAGTIAVGSVVTDISPMMRWTLALIAGGGTAGLIQTATVAIRGTSTATTAGTANWLIATFELLASIGATIVSMLMPLLAAAAVVLIMVGGSIYFFRLPARTKSVPASDSATSTRAM